MLALLAGCVGEDREAVGRESQAAVVYQVKASRTAEAGAASIILTSSNVTGGTDACIKGETWITGLTLAVGEGLLAVLREDYAEVVDQVVSTKTLGTRVSSISLAVGHCLHALAVGSQRVAWGAVEADVDGGP